MEESLLSNNRVQTPSLNDDSSIFLLPSPPWARSPTLPAIHRMKSEVLVFFSAAATAAVTFTTPRLAPCSSFPEKFRFKDWNISQRNRSNSAPSLLFNPSPSSSSSATAGSPIPIHNFSQPEPVSDHLRPSQATPSIVRHALFGVILYIITGVIAYIMMRGSFKCQGTFRIVDALYFSVVTLCTIGYGDIVPVTTSAKIFTCVFILVGFGVIDIYLNGLVTYMLDRQESILLSAMEEEGDNRMLFKTYVMDMKKGRMRIRMKVFLAMGVVVSCVGIGMIMIHLFEGLDWGDSFYLSVTSVTTVGYGDYAFKTLEGRCFAIVWLLVSTLAVARAFMYLAELRIDKRNRTKITKWVDHQKKIATASSLALGYDLVAAHLYSDGYLRSKKYYSSGYVRRASPVDYTTIESSAKTHGGLANGWWPNHV